MKISSFQEMYVAELQEAHSFEVMLVEALSTMASNASESRLQKAFQEHAAQTKEHQRAVEGLLHALDAELREHTDQGLQSLTIEAQKMAELTDVGPLRDAAMIASAQRIEHYEIAVYGTLVSYAKALGRETDQQILAGILEQEKDADLLLSDLAEGMITPAIVEAEAR